MIKKKKICLFTAHSPAGGGGAVTLRSVIENIPEIEVIWFYLAKEPVIGNEKGFIDESEIEKPGLKGIISTWKIISDKYHPTIEKIVKKLLDEDCDAYWIVSHHEGLRVALELTRRQNKTKVHLSIHDDWAGICYRSRRYYFFSWFANKMTSSTLKAVKTIDVTSYGMQKYYHEMLGVDSSVIHRYIPSANLKTSESFSEDNAQITVGHIGSVYDIHEFLRFVKIFKDFATKIKKKAVINMWGTHFGENSIPDDLKETVHFFRTLPEEEIIPKLAKCTFLFAMYPMTKAYEIFSLTSMQTKLGSYIQAGRPIFAQCPSDSSLTEFIKSTNTGVIWDSKEKNEGFASLQKVLLLKNSQNDWESSRIRYFGEKNLEVIKGFLI